MICIKEVVKTNYYFRLEKHTHLHVGVERVDVVLPAVDAGAIWWRFLLVLVVLETPHLRRGRDDELGLYDRLLAFGAPLVDALATLLHLILQMFLFSLLREQTAHVI